MIYMRYDVIVNYYRSRPLPAYTFTAL